MNSEIDVTKMVDHLFRHESGKMVAVLTRILGIHNIELAEDLVQDSFAKAIRDWTYKLPQNPAAWLMLTAKNACIDTIRKEKFKKQFNQEIAQLLSSEYTASQTVNHYFLDHEIQDSQLRMIFACCHPELGDAEQILLTLKTISGFSISEAGNALLMNYDTAKKRIQRAKKLIVEKEIRFEIPVGAELERRLKNVLRIIYLMFNEGYKSSSNDAIIRKDLCMEAMRLTILLTSHSLTQTPETFALLSLMCFLAARFDSRINENGEIILLENQDRSKWNRQLQHLGESYLEKSASGNRASEYHLQAAIALVHLHAKDFESTDWDYIYQLYCQLEIMNPSPIVSLNKAIVYSQIANATDAIVQILAIPNCETHCAQNYLFALTLAELYEKTGNKLSANSYWQKAIHLAPTTPEKALLEKKMKNWDY